MLTRYFPTDHALAGTGTTSNARASHVSFVVFGQVYSMKNGKTPNGRGGTIKHPAALAFERDFALQVRPEHKRRIGGRKAPLRSIVTVFYPSWRQDLDVSIVYDLLQRCGVVSNDRWIREKHEFAEVDAKNPRVEIILEEM